MGKYVIRTCLDSAKYPKCKGCSHNRYDPERDDMACWIDEDLQGKERLDYLNRLYEAFKSGEAVPPPF